MGITGFNRARRAIAIAKKRAQAEDQADPELKSWFMPTGKSIHLPEPPSIS